MRVSATKTAPRVERNVYLTSKKIKGYGQNNDYPQKVLEIINSSGTGHTCMDIYAKFVQGDGFRDQSLANTVLNTKNEKANSILNKSAKDLKNFNGFATLVKYDGMVQPVEYYNVPFEHCRLEINPKGEYTGRIAVYHDWTGLTGKLFRQADVRYINGYDPAKVLTEMTEAGGPEMYLGQILYYTADGDFEYPISPFDPVITDMLTEESCSTVKHRNAKYNFLPSGILVRKGKKPRTLSDGTIDPTDPYNQEMIASAEWIKNAQGDEKTSKIWVVDVDADEEKPEFIEFASKNYDRQYEHTEKTVKENIGSMFLIPPVLRGIDVGTGFGSELIQNAYQFMSSVTGNERRMLSEAFQKLLENYSIKFADYTITPLEYIGEEVESKNLNEIPDTIYKDLTRDERRSLIDFEPIDPALEQKTILAEVIGVGGTQSLVTIVSDVTLSEDQKIALIIKLFNFTEEEAVGIIKPKG